MPSANKRQFGIFVVVHPWRFDRRDRMRVLLWRCWEAIDGRRVQGHIP